MFENICWYSDNDKMILSSSSFYLDFKKKNCVFKILANFVFLLMKEKKIFNFSQNIFADYWLIFFSCIEISSGFNSNHDSNLMSFSIFINNRTHTTHTHTVNPTLILFLILLIYWWIIFMLSTLSYTCIHCIYIIYMVYELEIRNQSTNINEIECFSFFFFFEHHRSYRCIQVLFI